MQVGNRNLPATVCRSFTYSSISTIPASNEAWNRMRTKKDEDTKKSFKKK